jgi:glutamate-ammonia-ligase adenylyltransferase
VPPQTIEVQARDVRALWQAVFGQD